MNYAPENELGVVFLFSRLARKLGFEIDEIRPFYPDCIAYRDNKRVRIEFEYRSSNFARHRHDPKKCDLIVCWVDDWPAAPLPVFELRADFGLGFNVWIQPVGSRFHDALTKAKASTWSVASQAHKKDLVLFYRAIKDNCIRDIFRVTGPVEIIKSKRNAQDWKSRKAGEWAGGKDWMAPVRRVCTLKAPLHWTQLKNDPILKSAGFVRGHMRGRPRVTPYWHFLYRQIIDTNPSLEAALRPYEPGRSA
jgi:hypothetical protein